MFYNKHYSKSKHTEIKFYYTLKHLENVTTFRLFRTSFHEERKAAFVDQLLQPSIQSLSMKNGKCLLQLFIFGNKGEGSKWTLILLILLTLNINTQRMNSIINIKCHLTKQYRKPVKRNLPMFLNVVRKKFPKILIFLRVSLIHETYLFSLNAVGNGRCLSGFWVVSVKIMLHK